MNKRASVEHNGFELVCALVLLNKDINNSNDLITCLGYMRYNNTSYISMTCDRFISTKIIFNNETDFHKYVTDIGNKLKIVDNYIKNFKIELQSINILHIDNIVCIYISGKTNKHLEIDELNYGLDKLETKSDIYIKLKNNSIIENIDIENINIENIDIDIKNIKKSIIGLSVKQSKAATKSNYSVQNTLLEITGNKENDKQLTKEKKDYLREQGFPKFEKKNRDSVNALFYLQNKENPYMNKLKKEIENNKKHISKYLVEKLYCSNVNYCMYEFDGIKMTELVKRIDNIDISFEEHLPYYYDKEGNERKAAKLFYKLTCNNKVYRVEVRWKGNIHNTSPQFQIHEE
jgi:hypothetical protein